MMLIFLSLSLSLCHECVRAYRSFLSPGKKEEEEEEEDDRQTFTVCIALVFIRVFFSSLQKTRRHDILPSYLAILNVRTCI